MKNYSNIKDASNGKRMARKTHKDMIMLNTPDNNRMQANLIEWKLAKRMRTRQQ